MSEIIENNLFGGAEYLCAEVFMILKAIKFKSINIYILTLYTQKK